MLQIGTMWDVAAVFFGEPSKEHYLKGISRAIDLAHTSVKMHLERLKQENIIKEIIHTRGSRKFPVYKANIYGEEYRRLKKRYNVYSLEDLTEHLNNKLMPGVIILFGSYSRGEDVEESDIDIFVQCKKQDLNLKKYEKVLKRKIQLHFKEFKQFPKELKNNIVNGVKLKGYLDAF